MHCRRRQDDTPETDGFTLLELIAVLVVLAVMTSAVVPLFRDSISSLRADRGVRDVVGYIKYAQERAITDSTEYRFCIDVESSVFWVERLALIDDDGQKVFEGAAERRGLPEGMELEPTRAREDHKRDIEYICFYPNGACDVAKLQISQDTGDRITIETRGKLGQLDIEE